MKNKLLISTMLVLVMALFATINTNAQCCVAPSGLTVVSIGRTDADLQWNRVKQAGCTTPTRYRVHYRAVGTTTWTVRIVTTKKDDIHGDTTAMNLTPATTYQWGVLGICNGSPTAWVVGPKFTTVAIPATLSSRISNYGSNLIARVYPSLMQNSTTSIVGQLRSPGDLSIFVSNILGQITYKSTLHQSAGDFLIPLDFTNVSTGLYNVVIINGSERISVKVEKQ